MIGFKVKGLRILWPPVFCDDAPSRRGAAPLSILPQWALTSVPWRECVEAVLSHSFNSGLEGTTTSNYSGYTGSEERL